MLIFDKILTMAFRCDNCGKHRDMGHRVSHAKNRTNHAFKPNIQKKTIVANGRRLSMKLCTKCIKLLGKIEKDKREKIAKAVLEAPTV